MVTVAIIGAPLRLLHAWEEHSDALLREYALGWTGAGHPYSLGDLARARNARIALVDHIRHAPGSSTSQSTVDVEVTLPASVEPGDFSMLQAVAEHANTLARRGELLTLPSLPEIVALRNWVCEEVVGQAGGRAPLPWNPNEVATSDVPLASWAGIESLPSDRAWLVGDDHNRIVAASPPALALLRWGGHDIVGQRILVVIPPRFREAHVAGFTHATVTGSHRLLGQDLEVDAWTHDGDEVAVTLTLERHTAAGGRSVYVAWLRRRG